ncbi:MAG: DNA repair protein RadA [Lautropia sp.]|nr:DNA repair protein RadA [Lautropia sp.]
MSGKTQFVCRACGAGTAKWLGQCPACQAWNTLEEIRLSRKETAAARRLGQGMLAETSSVALLSTVPTDAVPRWPTGMGEFDRVLGGGMVPGSVVLIGGDPGIGKSTLLLQALANMSADLPVLYVSGEESLAQVALRGSRLGVDGSRLPMLAEISISRILDAVARTKPSVLVVDSIQTVMSDDLQSAPGSVSQVRDCAAQLTRLAKQQDIAVVMIGHVTKEGALAGPRVLEHMVDTVLYFEGDNHSTFRLIRAIKNRFGAVNELGVFGMTDRGLKTVSNPSALFLSQHAESVAGSCVLITQEGSRPLLVEIQALVDQSHGGQPRRLCIGLDPMRLNLLVAVLNRHAGIQVHDQDVFLNAVGGVRITEPAADMAVVLAVLSSLKNRPLPRGLAVFGELGLAGEVRPSPRGQERLREALKLGFDRVICPKANAPRKPLAGLQVIAVERIDEALASAWGT